ncbi:hypothetical protein SUGI_0572530 [Cryptomeria japonica]|nr:hypothetical protein SUGI_0572530 [Cryptomeria japonica]
MNEQALKFVFPIRSAGKGKQVHGHVFRTGFDLNGVVGNALFNIYSKCRNVVAARHVFDRMTNHRFGLPNGMAFGFVPSEA